MNFAVVKHIGSNDKYLFQIPDFESVPVGAIVLVDTCKGMNQIGICAAQSFHGDPETVLPLWNTTLDKLRKVRAKFPPASPMYYYDEPEQNKSEDKEKPF